MTCNITCAIAVAFIAVAIYMCYSSKNVAYTLEDKLDEKQKMIYEKIIKERLRIYYIASGAGLFLGFIYLIFFSRKQNLLHKLCTFIVILFVTQIIVYMIYPKSLYMLDYINTNDQAKAWMKVYNQMNRNYMIGFLFGLIGFGLLCLAFFQ